MTKLRAPLTFAQAAARVAGVIGYDGIAKLCRRRVRAVRYWSDPDCRTTPTMTQALALDAAYRAGGGDGAPYLEAFAFQLDMQVAPQDACRRALTDDLARAAREGGDAIALGLTITASNASPRDTLRAVTEAEQAHSAWGAVLRRLTSFLPVGAGPGAGMTGGTHP